ncbi:hypothetical protein ACODT3_44160 [Streptomyces sp. 4.24]|uniref:hypothetical protein n=1 Tax=Streptomyces tritrimontium TaxID=3406573 RepID=UPI003BB58A0C
MTPDSPRRLTRADIQTHYGYSAKTLERLWADRANNNHPPAEREGRALTWDADEFEAWDRRRQDIIGVAEFARILGHKDNSWVTKAATIPPAGFPEPFEWADPVNHRRPRWHRADAQRFADNRNPTRPPTGAGRPSGARNGTHYNDPRFTLALDTLTDHPHERPAQTIARLHQQMPGSSASTWTKILQAVREQEEEQ